jgi:cell division protein FtsB
MWTRHHKNRNTGRLILPTACAAFIAYFGYHTYNGEFGMNSKEQLGQRREVLVAQLDKLKFQREHIEHRVQLLRDGTVEKDMLDEQARRALNFSKPNEVTVVYDPD